MPSPSPRPPCSRVELLFPCGTARRDARRHPARSRCRCPTRSALNLGRRRFEAHLDAAAGRRELDGVGDQVPHDLLQPIRIAGDGAERRVESTSHRDAAWPRPRAAATRSPPRRSAAGSTVAHRRAAACRRRCATRRAGPRSAATAPSRRARSRRAPRASASASSLPLREHARPAEHRRSAACAARATAWRGTRPSAGSPLRPRATARRPLRSSAV